MKKILITLILIIVANNLTAQDYKFGKVSKQELEETFYPEDSSANAAILYKKRRTYFNYVQGDGFKVVTEIQERIKIYNSEGFDWATKIIKYYDGDNGKEKISSLKATTFNLNGTKIEETDLKKSEIFDEQSNEFWAEKKFTMPNIKDGCIVEWKYKLTSPFKSIDRLQFQYDIPVKKMDVSIETPEYFVYKKRTKGFFYVAPVTSKKTGKIVINSKDRSERSGADWQPTKTTFSQSSIDYFIIKDVYVAENIPALIEESHVDNIENYQTAIVYEYSELHWPREPIKFYSNNWEDVTKTIYNDYDFSKQIYKSNHYEDDLALVLATAKTDSEKIVAIFEMVKQKITWNNYTGISAYNGTRKAYKEGVGNASDINLNLVSMLNSAGLKANPVIISTRANGIPLFPTIEGFNFVIAAVEMNDGLILLDATDTNSTPNNLPLRDINWNGRLIRKDGSSSSVKLTPTKPSAMVSNLTIVLNEDGEGEGMLRKKITGLNAIKYRDKYSKVQDEDIISKIEGKFSGIEIGDFRVSNKDNCYKDLMEMYKFSTENVADIVASKMYLRPLLFNSVTENPFKIKEREYPIDFGTPISEKNTVRITIPEGYKVVSIPENLGISLPNDYGFYKFKVSVSGNNIITQTQLEIKTAIYPATNYTEIKDFYSQIVNKNSERIIIEKVSL